MQTRNNLIIIIAAFLITFIPASKMQAAQLEEQAEYPPSQTFQTKVFDGFKTIVNASVIVIRGIGIGIYCYFKYYAIMGSGLCTNPKQTILHEIIRPLWKSIIALSSAIYLACTDLPQFIFQVRILGNSLTQLAAANPEQAISLAVESLLSVFHARFCFGVSKIFTLQKTAVLTNVVKQSNAVQAVSNQITTITYKFAKKPFSVTCAYRTYVKGINAFYYSQSYRCYFLVEAHNLIIRNPYQLVIPRNISYLMSYSTIKQEQPWLYYFTESLEETRRFRYLRACLDR